MRLDKYLKVSRIIKRRTVANEAADGGRVTLNGRVAKPAAQVNPGDIIEIRFGEHIMRARVESIDEHAKKGEAAMMYSLIEGEQL